MGKKLSLILSIVAVCAIIVIVPVTLYASGLFGSKVSNKLSLQIEEIVGILYSEISGPTGIKIGGEEVTKTTDTVFKGEYVPAEGSTSDRYVLTDANDAIITTSPYEYTLPAVQFAEFDESVDNGTKQTVKYTFYFVNQGSSIIEIGFESKNESVFAEKQIVTSLKYETRTSVAMADAFLMPQFTNNAVVVDTLHTTDSKSFSGISLAAKDTTGATTQLSVILVEYSITVEKGKSFNYDGNVEFTMTFDGQAVPQE